MITATELLMYLRKNYTTYGILQRQKLLYYIQAWSLAWTGRPAYNDDILAWRNGPVVFDAWIADKESPSDANVSCTAGILDPDLGKIIESVFGFYGKRTGSDLINLTHSEQPWDYAYNTLGKGEPNMKISTSDMKRFYSQKFIKGEAVPARPELKTTDASLFEVVDAMSVELSRWAGVNRILAER